MHTICLYLDMVVSLFDSAVQQGNHARLPLLQETHSITSGLHANNHCTEVLQAYWVTSPDLKAKLSCPTSQQLPTGQFRMTVL